MLDAMGWMEFVLGVLTLVLGTGWLFTYRSYRRKAKGEAAQSEAEGWKAMQDVYEETIDDLKQSCEYIRNDRNLLREENTKLREENNMLRDKYNELEQQIIELRKELARQGRKLESVIPFACGVAGCTNRKRVEIQTYDQPTIITDTIKEGEQ